MGLECLKDYIGIRWANGTPPVSGVYVNDLPGVSLKSIDSLANAEQMDFLGVWNAVQARSLTRLQTHVTNYFAKRYQLRTISESLELPKYYQTDENVLTPAGASLRGFDYDMGWYGSPMAAIHIEELRLYLLAPQNPVNIYVYEIIDTNRGNLLDTLTVNGVAGWNVIKVGKDYSAYKIAVCYDATSIDSVYMPNGYFNGDLYQGMFFNWGVPQSPYQAILRGFNTSKPFGNFNEVANTYGLSGSVSVTCSFDGILCRNKSKFTQCLWYLLGYELITERIFTERLNRFTTIDLKKVVDLRQYFFDTFEEEMAATFDGIDLATWDGCINCNAQYQLVHALP